MKNVAIHEVAVIAHARETLDSLEDHMRTAGLMARRSRFLGHPQEMLTGKCGLAVVFPDEFPARAVEAALADLELCEVGLMVVTANQGHFDSWLARDHANRMVLRKPVWTWNIIDAMQSWLTVATRDVPARSLR